MGVGGITYHWFNPRADKILVKDFCECHENLLSEENNNAWKVCRQCNEMWSRKKQAFLSSINFTHCNQPVVDVWSKDDFISYVFDKIDPLKGANCWLALNQNKVVIGYCWGLSMELDFLEDKLDAPGLSRFIKRKFGSTDSVAYHERIGVLEQYRNLKIATELLSRQLENFRDMDLKIGVTLVSEREAAIAAEWLQRLGFVSLYDYKDDEKKIVLACEFNKVRA